jgi:dTDP-4-dehydrorhamnose reductase
MRILITGGRGQLGRALQQALADHRPLVADLPELDITDWPMTEAAIGEAGPELVIHCAAYTDVDGSARDPDLAYRVNALGTRNVAQSCRLAGADLLHLSTNEVFDGRNPAGYEEWMPLSPINAYGRSKAAAELLAGSLVERCIIVRTAWLYASGGRNFVHAILERARTNGAVRVVADEIGNPTYVGDLAAAIARLAVTRRTGIYHLTNAGSCSRWAFAAEVLRLAGLGHVPNRPLLARHYQRASNPPRFGALSNVAAASLGIRLRPWQEALASFMQEELVTSAVAE